MAAYTIFERFLTRLFIGYGMMGLFVLWQFSFVFNDPFTALLAMTSGLIIAAGSCWYHYFLPPEKRKDAIGPTILVSLVLVIMIYKKDIGRREELDALVTLFTVLPQLLIIALSITFYGIKDLRELKR